MRIQCGLMVALLLVPMTLGWSADEVKKEKKAKKPAPVYKLPSTITLNEEQQGQMEALNKEYQPKLAELQKKRNEIMTAEQKKAMKEASAAAKAEGKKGKDFKAAVDAAVNLTDDQKTKIKAVDAELKALQDEIFEKVSAFLTEDQKALLSTPKQPKKKKNENA